MSLPSVIAIVIAVTVFSFVPSIALAADGAACTHIRTSERSIAGLIRKGQAESPLLERLIDRINSSDVIVYLRTERELPSHVDGQLTFMGAGGNHRYVVVALAFPRAEVRTIAVLGHELRHALEVADHPEIVDLQTFTRAYQRFGFKGVGTWRGPTFDTQAAIEAGNRVGVEVSRRIGTVAEAATMLETRP